jgi:tRNA threonylcarbamoyladenosine biosynthesis protein TsaB
MIILTLRTDKPEAEVGLYDGHKQLAYITWQAHRELSDTIHYKIDEILKSQAKSWSDVQGIVTYKGPGSFTGLRIGISVANAIANSQHIPIVARSDSGWLEKGVQDLLMGQNDQIALPEYGSEVNVTRPRK